MNYHWDFKGHFLAFTGPRPPKLGGYSQNPIQTEVKHFLHRVITQYSLICYKYNKDVREPKGELVTELQLITGGALGVDTWAADAAVEYGFDLHLYLPFPTMGNNWPMKADRDKLQSHRDYSDQYDLVVVTSDHFHSGAYHIRDYRMADDCDLLIAVYDGSGGGTGATFDYSQKKGKMIHRYDPKTKEETLYKGYEVIV